MNPRMRCLCILTFLTPGTAYVKKGHSEGQCTSLFEVPGLFITVHENLRECLICVLTRTHIRIRSPRLTASGL